MLAPLRRRRAWTARRSWRPRSSGSSWPSSGCRPTSRSCRTLLRQWLAGPPPAESLRERAGLTLEHLVEATQVRFPAVSRPGPRRGVPLVRPAAAAPQPRQGLRRASATTCATWTATRTRRTAPSGSQAMVASAEPLVRLHRPAHRPARPRPRAAAGGADPPLLRQPRAVRGHRAARSPAAGSSPPSTPARPARSAWSPPPSTSPRCPTRSARSASSPPTSPSTALVADLYVAWEDQPDADAMAGAARRAPRRARRCPRPSAGSPPPSPAPAAP